ncbi:hypothetical protein Y032_0184g1014 [Ancylostoma ceylanicum]|uniref:Uncharacterized protein n=1 Tax=Ancylostoma ceylanicum TaxID=53326 RepID=A0A016SRN8_9BILA|nr:hypothetical protein Y032_0184g1014 [Ancylostoma ceylanicum]
MTLARGDKLGRIPFTDEKIFTPKCAELLSMVSPKAAKVEKTHFSQSMMVWGRISGLDRTKLVFVQQGVETYVELHLEQILEYIVIPWTE